MRGDDLLVGGASQPTVEGDGGDDALVLESSQLARLSGDRPAQTILHFQPSASARHSITSTAAAAATTSSATDSSASHGSTLAREAIASIPPTAAPRHRRRWSWEPMSRRGSIRTTRSTTAVNSDCQGLLPSYPGVDEAIAAAAELRAYRIGPLSGPPRGRARHRPSRARHEHAGSRPARGVPRDRQYRQNHQPRACSHRSRHHGDTGGRRDLRRQQRSPGTAVDVRRATESGSRRLDRRYGAASRAQRRPAVLDRGHGYRRRTSDRQSRRWHR